MKMKNVFPIIILLMLVYNQVEAQDAPTQQIYLWENGAPGFENRKNEPEQAKDWWVKNIHNPSITAFFPEKGKATVPLL